MRHPSALFVLLAAMVLAAPHKLRAEADVALVDFGVICQVTTDGEREAPLTEAGVVRLVDQWMPFDVRVARVPAHIGLSFGLRLLLDPDGVSNGTRIVVIHPPMGPRGVTVESWSAPLQPGVPNLNLFTFEEEYEMVQGRWKIRVMDATGVLFEQVFDVLPAGSVPEVQDICFGAELTS